MRLSRFASILAVTFLCSVAAWAQPAGVTLPATAVNVLVQNDLTHINFLNVTLANVPSGFTVANGLYSGWCVDSPHALLPFSGKNITLVSSYDPSAPTILPWITADLWSKVNYILNHKNSAGYADVQRAIWDLLGVSNIDPADPAPFPESAASDALWIAALQNGSGYIPGPGNSVAVIIREDAILGSSTLQDAILEVPIPSINKPPQISCGNVSTVTGAQGASYSAQLSVTGGTAPFTFQIVSGTLPSNLTLNTSTGLISGTPLVAGSFPFTVKVTDSEQPPLSSTTSSACNVQITPTNTGGNFTTYTQGGWGAAPHGNNPGAILAKYFSMVFPGGSVSIGSGPALTFTSAASISAFLPAGGTAGTLTKSATNPTTSSAGVIAGQLLAATLSLDFSNAGITRFGLANLKATSGALAGYTVTQIVAFAHQAISGNFTGLPAGVTISILNDALNSINNNFDNGTQNLGYLN